jgi:hypothetical protein
MTTLKKDKLMSQEGAKKGKRACPERMDSVELSWKLNCRRKKWGVTFKHSYLDFLYNIAVIMSSIEIFAQ